MMLQPIINLKQKLKKAKMEHDEQPVKDKFIKLAAEVANIQANAALKQAEKILQLCAKLNESIANASTQFSPNLKSYIADIRLKICHACCDYFNDIPNLLKACSQHQDYQEIIALWHKAKTPNQDIQITFEQSHRIALLIINFCKMFDKKSLVELLHQEDNLLQSNNNVNIQDEDVINKLHDIRFVIELLKRTQIIYLSNMDITFNPLVHQFNQILVKYEKYTKKDGEKNDCINELNKLISQIRTETQKIIKLLEEN